jgi:predicted transcriptional regulator
MTALGYLRRETPRGMLVTLLSEPSTTASDLAAELDVSRPTVSKYAGELEAAGLLSREDGYAVAAPETVLMLVVGYADSFDERAVALAQEAAELVTFDG